MSALTVLWAKAQKKTTLVFVSHGKNFHADNMVGKAIFVRVRNLLLHRSGEKAVPREKDWGK